MTDREAKEKEVAAKTARAAKIVAIIVGMTMLVAMLLQLPIWGR